MLRFFLLLICLPFAAFAQGPESLDSAAPKAVPRILLAIYDSKEEPGPRTTEMHHALELPANHLGYVLHYQDIRKPLPPLGPEVAGAVVWFNPGVIVPDPAAWLEWLEKQILEKDRRLLVFGGLGIDAKYRNLPGGMAQLNRIYHQLGIHDENLWVDIVYGAKVLSKDRSMMEYERALERQLPPYFVTSLAGATARSFLTVVNPDEHKGKAELVTIGPQGGYVAYNYALYRLLREGTRRVSLQQWLIDPFAFLRLALAMPATQPAPDPTTYLGRRVGYMQMDGDGWNNYSALLQHRGNKIIAAQAAYETLIRPHPDVPLSVGVIGAEIETDCYGLSESKAWAAKLLGLGQVEAASHTYSHPQYWRYFQKGDPGREKALLPFYPPKPSLHRSFLERLTQWFHKDPWEKVEKPVLSAEQQEENHFLEEYFNRLPRSYACAPFTLAREIAGNAALLQSLLPTGKRVKTLHWSGDTEPFDEALAAARGAKLAAIGGGTMRYDPDYPSLSTLPPYGFVSGSEVQIYSANGNENTLRTQDEERFTGLRYLPAVSKLTETPLRLMPLSVYFHASDAGNPLAAQAVRENIDFFRAQPIIRLFPSEYTNLAHGFFESTIMKDAANAWIVQGNAVRTVRFDHASRRSVDFAQSEGVWGQRYFQGSLYVALMQQPEHRVVLKDKVGLELYPEAAFPYLIESSWDIKALKKVKDVLTISARGYGVGAMRWRMPKPGTYEIRLSRAGRSEEAVHQVPTDADGILRLALAEANGIEATIRIAPLP